MPNLLLIVFYAKLMKISPDVKKIEKQVCILIAVFFIMNSAAACTPCES